MLFLEVSMRFDFEFSHNSDGFENIGLVEGCWTLQSLVRFLEANVAAKADYALMHIKEQLVLHKTISFLVLRILLKSFLKVF
jgi:hypothetical protein